MRKKMCRFGVVGSLVGKEKKAAKLPWTSRSFCLSQHKTSLFRKGSSGNSGDSIRRQVQDWTRGATWYFTGDRTTVVVLDFVCTIKRTPVLLCARVPFYKRSGDVFTASQ